MAAQADPVDPQQGRMLAEYDRSLTAAEAEAAALRLEVAKLRKQVRASGVS